MGHTSPERTPAVRVALNQALTPSQAALFAELAAALELHGLDLAVTDLPDDSCEPQDWQPDHLMVTEVLNSPKSFLHMTKLPHPDRAYLVAGLTVRGMVAEEIADRTHCSLRLIRTIRSWEMTAVCKWVHHQTTVLERDLSTERAAHAHTRRALADSSRDNERLRDQLAQILDKLQAGTLKAFPRCGHPKVKYNVYRHTDRSGPEPRTRELCRECNRERVANFRTKKRQEQAGNAAVLQILHTDSVPSAS